MKKHILFALFLSLATSICYSQVKINVQGGAGINGITKEEAYKANFGYRFGVGVEIPLVRTWSLQTGLQFLNRKSTADESVFGYTLYEGEEVALYQKVKSTINAVYLQLPVKIATCLPIGKNCGLQISAGPYIAYGIGGSTDGDVWQEPHWNSSDLVTPGKDLAAHMEFKFDTFDKNGGLKRLDIGLSVGADFKYKSFFVGCGVEYGLLPIDKEFPKNMLKATLNGDQTTVAPHNFGVEFHVGYCFSLGK